ncbi:hypothetical protein A2U01_0101928, partial [Trifolium medium]|nr:hypothetical protein [Trifolium medium]
LKLNVDAHLSDDGRWGIALVLRGDDGRCVGAETRVVNSCNCAILAEATGLQEDLGMIDRLKLTKVILEMEAEQI